MNIEEITFTVTKTTTFEIVISKEEGYDMPETPKDLVDLITTIRGNPARELAWSTENLTNDDMVIDNYEIKEG